MSELTFTPLGASAAPPPATDTAVPKATAAALTFQPIAPGVAPDVAPPAADVSTFLTDPVQAKQEAAISVLSQQALDSLPPYYASMVTASLGKAAGPSAIDQWKGGVDFMAKQREIDALSYKQALGDKTPETAARIKELQAEQAKDPQANIVQSLISGAGEQGAAGLRAAGMWMLGALTWPYRKGAQLLGIDTQDRQAELLAQVGEKFGLSPERTAALTQNPVVALGETAKEATAGITGPTYRTLVDQGVNPDVASAASFVLGGALTALQAIPAGRLVPGAQRIGESAFKAAVVAMVDNGTLSTLAKLWGTRVATIGAEQAALGMANATVQVLGEEWARQYSNMATGAEPPTTMAEMNAQEAGRGPKYIAPTSFEELTKDILVTGATQAAVGTAIGGLTALKEMKPAYVMGAKLRSYVEDVRAARASNVTQGQIPKAEPKALPVIDTAPIEEAHAILEQTPQERSPQAMAETAAKLDETVKAITANPTPDTVPQAIEAAKLADTLQTENVPAVVSEPVQAGHRPPGPDTGAPIYDLTRNGVIPEDFYSARGLQIYGVGDSSDRMAWRLALSLRGKPDAEVSVYRAVGSGEPITINPGDWVTTDRTYAIYHGESALGGDYKIAEAKVPARTLYGNADSILEYGYFPNERATASQVQAQVQQGISVPDAQLPIDQPWARSEMELRTDARNTAVEMLDSGDAIDAQEFAALMKQNELPGAEKPLAWYEDQWANMEKQRTYIESAKNETFLSTLNKDELQNTLQEIASNPDAVVAKGLESHVEAATRGMTDSEFQSFVAEAVKNPSKWRKAIETALDPEAAQNLQDKVAQTAASKAARIVAADELLKKYDNTRVGELTTSQDPEQQKAATLVGRLLRAADKEAGMSIDYDYRVQIQALQDSYSRESGPKLREVRDRLRTYYEQHPDVTPDAATTGLLNQRLVGDMTVKEVRDVAEKISEARDVGKQLLQLKRNTERLAVEADRANLIKDIMAGKPFEPTTDVGSLQQKKAAKGTIVKRGEAVVWSPLRIIDRLGPTAKRLYREVQNSRDEEWRAYDSRTEPLLKKVKDFGIQPRTLAKIIKAPNGMEYTVSDVLAMKWAMKDEGARQHLIYGNGIPEETVNALIAKLPANVSELADAIAQAEGEEAWKRLARAFVEDTNSPPPPKVQNHFPIRVQDKQYDTPGSAIADDMLMRGGMRMAKVNKRMMTGRKKIAPQNQSAMRLDGVALAFQSMREQEHYIASWRTAKRLKKVFLDDKNVRDAIRQKYGESWNKAIASWVNSFSSPDAFKATTPADRFTGYMRGALTASGIAWNIVTLGYNFTGPIMAMGDAGPRRLLTSLGKWMKNPKEMYERVTTSLPQVKHASIDPVMNAIKNADPSAYKTMLKMAKELGYKPLEAMDMWTRLIVADAVHQHALDMDPNMSDSDAWYKALESIQRNQPSGEAQDLPMMYHAQSLQMVLVFTRQLNQIFNMWTADIPNDVRNGEVLKAMGSAFGIAISGFLIAMMGNKRAPKDAKEAVAWTLDQFIASVPFIGNIIEPVLTGKGYVSRGAEIIPGATQTVTDIAGMFKREPEAKRVDYAIRTLIDISRFLGLPAVAEKRVYDFIRTGDPWSLIGGRPKP